MQAEACTSCGARTGRIEAEDGPPWLTVLLLGPLLAALTFGISMQEGVPVWVAFPVMTLIAIVSVLALLPRVKGALIGALWNMRTWN